MRRDTHAAQWYPAPGGVVDKFDDLPRERRGNIDVTDPPLNRAAGQQPLWNEAQIADVIAFLETLTDRGVIPAAP